MWRQSDGHFSDEFSPFHLFIRRRRAARRRRVAVRKSCFVSHERQRQFENNEFRCGGAARPLHAAIAACTMKFSNQQPPLGRRAARRRRRQPCLARVIPPIPNRFLYQLEISTLSVRTLHYYTDVHDKTCIEDLHTYQTHKVTVQIYVVALGMLTMSTKDT